jgi:hypothetical protein
VIVGGGADGGGPEHAWTCLSVEVGASGADPLEKHEALDGGQRDEDGKQVILVRHHELHRGFDKTSTYARRVRWVLDVEKIVGAFAR